MIVGESNVSLINHKFVVYKIRTTVETTLAATKQHVTMSWSKVA